MVILYSLNELYLEILIQEKKDFLKAKYEIKMKSIK